MASRAAGRRRARRPRTTCTVYDTAAHRGRPARSSCTGSATMFDPQLAGYWGSDDVDTATETFVQLVHDHAGQGRRGQGVAAVDAAHEIALRRRLPGRRPALHRRRLQLPGADRRRRRRTTPTRCWASSRRSPRPPRPRCRARRRRRGDLPARRSWTPTLELSPAHLQRADLLLQDRDRLPVLAQRPPARLQHGRRTAGGPLAGAPGPGLRAGRPGRAAAGPGAGRATGSG